MTAMQNPIQLLVRAIITGFGLRLGVELAKYVSNKVMPKEEQGKTEDEEDEELGTVTADPPEV
jgi:hypothetical protein